MATLVLLISPFLPPEVGGGATGASNRASIFLNMGYSVFDLTSFPAHLLGKFQMIEGQNALS